MTISLPFLLEVHDDWPPVGSESLPFDRTDHGFKLLAAPLFVKNLSVGDVINIDGREGKYVSSWTHFLKSKHSTIWILRMRNDPGLENVFSLLREMGCNTVSQDALGCSAVDVPGGIDLIEVDSILSGLDPKSFAVAYSSLRHED